MEPVNRSNGNLIDVILARETTDESQRALLTTIKKSQHPEMHRMLDLTSTLV